MADPHAAKDDCARHAHENADHAAEGHGSGWTESPITMAHWVMGIAHRDATVDVRWAGYGCPGRRWCDWISGCSWWVRRPSAACAQAPSGRTDGRCGPWLTSDGHDLVVRAPGPGRWGAAVVLDVHPAAFPVRLHATVDGAVDAMAVTWPGARLRPMSVGLSSGLAPTEVAWRSGGGRRDDRDALRDRQ